MSKRSLIPFCECAILVALATVLSLVAFSLPYGGSVTLFSMLPILLFSYRRGMRWGLVCGFLYASLQLLLGIGNLSYLPNPTGIVLCILLDYILPFSAIGLGGMLRGVHFIPSERANRMLTFTLGALLVILFRYICHILSGAVIWYSLNLEWEAGNPDHMVFRYGAWAFSALYNGAFMIPETVLSIIGCLGIAPISQVMKAKR